LGKQVITDLCALATVMECGTEWGVTPTWPASGSCHALRR
jgi:hypothetical protein